MGKDTVQTPEEKEKLKLAQKERDYKFWDHQTRRAQETTVAYAQIAIKSLFLINGFALISLAPLATAVDIDLEDLTDSAFWFTLGLTLTLVSTLFIYFSCEKEIHRSNEKRERVYKSTEDDTDKYSKHADIYERIGIACSIAALIMFFTGTFILLYNTQNRYLDDDMPTNSLSYNVIDVTGGDTFKAQGTQYRIHGIEALHKDQLCDQDPCGKMATEYAQTLIEKYEGLTCTEITKDRYKKIVVQCELLNEGGDFARKMVESGYAFNADKTSKDTYANAENIAHKSQAGAWGYTDWQLPWDYHQK